MSTIFLAHVTVYDPALSAERVERYCSGNGFVTGIDPAYRPAGVGAHVYYEPRIQQPANMRRDCFAQGTTGGASSVGYGELVLANADGALDGLLNVSLAGRPVEIIVGQMLPWRPPVFTTVLKGTMEQPRITWDTVAIRLRDRQAELDIPINPNRYAGTNSLPNGIEGTASDLQGQPKPRCFGRVINVSPPCVNTSRLIYQVHDGAVLNVAAVYDQGAALTQGTDYASQADMETTAPAAGNYRVWPAGGCFRLGSSAVGQITADVNQGGTAADRSAAQVALAIVTGPGGISIGDVVAGDITDLDTANAAELGLWVDGDLTCRDALDQVLGSVGAWWGFDRMGRFRCRRLEAPAGTPAAVLTQTELLRLDLVPSADDGAGVPAWRYTLSYGPIWTVQDSDLAGSVPADRRALLREERRSKAAADATVQITHKLATDLAADSLIADGTAAATEADRRLALYKVQRLRLEAQVRLDSGLAAAIDLGAVVQVVHTRFGLEAGRLMVVTGIRADLRLNQLDLTLWG